LLREYRSFAQESGKEAIDIKVGMASMQNLLRYRRIPWINDPTNCYRQAWFRSRHFDSEESEAELPPSSGTSRKWVLREAATAEDDGLEGRKFGDRHVDSLCMRARSLMSIVGRAGEKVSVQVAAAGF
jgi:hypothetical protein